LKEDNERGDIISVTAEHTELPCGEDIYLDLKVIIVYKKSYQHFNAVLTKPCIKMLYPGAGKLERMSTAVLNYSLRCNN
jgi:ASC-1-like (ASCH) protein